MIYRPEVKAIEYKTLESETIVFLSTAYAVVSLFLVGVVFRFWMPEKYEYCVVGVYAVLSFTFLLFVGHESRKRTKINKLPSFDIIKLCYFAKNYIGKETGVWCTTYESFNRHAMELLFDDSLYRSVPPHDYFSYMLAERYLIIEGIVDPKINNNLKINLTKKAYDRLAIYKNSKKW